MDILRLFSERLKELMFDADILSERLGSQIGVNGSTVRRWLSMKSKPNLKHLLALSRFFKCSLEFLTGRDINNNYSERVIPPFPKRLREVMRENGKTRRWLHQNTKFKDSYIYSWDHGAIPDIFSIQQLADLFKCSLDYLVGLESYNPYVIIIKKD